MAEFIEGIRKLVISGELENAEVVTRPYSTSARIIPTSVTFTWTQTVAESKWSLWTVDVSGPRPKADGSPSKNHATTQFHAGSVWPKTAPPQWLIDLAGATLATLQNGDGDGDH